MAASMDRGRALQEISQFTYFQQAGGMPLAVPAVEIPYGLERILMALQGVDHFRDIRYSPSLTYGALRTTALSLPCQRVTAWDGTVMG